MAASPQPSVQDIVRGPPQNEAGGGASPRVSSMSSGSPMSSGELSSPGDEKAGREEGYDCQWVGNVDKKYECPICLLVQKNPLQTYCGHRYCKPCIRRWVREKPDPVCPSCNAPLHKGQMFPDTIAQREIMELKIKCSNQECPETMELGSRNKHMAVCEYGLTPCPNQCSAILRRRSLQRHLAHDCERSTFTCTHCEAEISLQDKESHLSECPMMRVRCSCCHAELLHKELEEHKKSSCLKALVPCEYQRFGCSATVERNQLESHYTSDVNKHLQLVSSRIATLESGPMWRQGEGAGEVMPSRPTMPPPAVQYSLDSHSSGFTTGDYLHDSDYAGSVLSSVQPRVLPSYPHSDPLHTRAKWRAGEADPSLPHSDITAGHRRPVAEQDLINTYSERLQKAEQSVARLEQTVRAQAAKLSQYERTVVQLQSTVTDFEGRNCGGTYYWKITEYEKKRRDAMSGRSIALHSPGFYSSFYGYKMCVRLNLNGVESAFGTHISVFLHLMRGDCDDLLKWPFKGKITLYILDQNEIAEQQHHIIETLYSKPDLAAFQRTMSNRNHKGFGYLEFAPITVIESKGFVKNDMLIIKAVIEVADQE